MQDDVFDQEDGDEGAVLSEATDFRTCQAIHAKRNDQWWSVLLEIEGTIEAFIANAEERGARTRVPGGPVVPNNDVAFVVPVAYGAKDRSNVPPQNPGFDGLRTQPVSMFARQAFIDEINQAGKGNNPLRDWNVFSVLLGAPVKEEFLDFNAEWPDTKPHHPPLSDEATVMAVVDDGIAIANDLFRDGNVSSRVAFAALLETVPSQTGGQSTQGRDLTGAEINALLSDNTHSGLLDEDRFYQRTGQVDFYTHIFSTVALRSSHGSHVMALAAGESMQTAQADRPIICAALPSRLVRDTSGIELLPSFYLSFQKLIAEGRRFRRKDGSQVPVIFNLSYGNSGGPHDGTGLFAQLFEHFFSEATAPIYGLDRAWLTLPAGNTNLERMHAVAEPGTKETTLDLRVLPDDRTCSEVQFWMPFNGGSAPDTIEIKVESPLGQTRKIKARGQSRRRFKNLKGQEIARLTYSFSGGTIQRGIAKLLIWPTAGLTAGEPLAPSGIWKITITPGEAAEAPVEVWIRRDETIPGLSPGAKQAFFDNPDYVRFDQFGAPLATDPAGTDCPVRRAGTLSGFACGETPVVVAGYTVRTAEIAAYSSQGPCNRPSSAFGSNRDGPDMTAEGDESVVLPGVLSAGSRSGSFVRRTGTSASAPRMARAASIAIHDASQTARGWAVDPTASVPDLKRIQGSAGAPRTRAGSGLYSYPVNWVIPGTE